MPPADGGRSPWPRRYSLCSGTTECLSAFESRSGHLALSLREGDDEPTREAVGRSGGASLRHRCHGSVMAAAVCGGALPPPILRRVQLNPPSNRALGAAQSSTKGERRRVSGGSMDSSGSDGAV